MPKKSKKNEEASVDLGNSSAANTSKKDKKISKKMAKLALDLSDEEAESQEEILIDKSGEHFII